MTHRIKSNEERFLTKYSINPISQCWEWTARKYPSGYGQFSWLVPPNKHKTQLSHRCSYLLFKGPIPIGINVLHKCDNPSCVNPDHLFLGTTQDNSDDKVSKNRHNHGNISHQHILSELDVRNIRSQPISNGCISKWSKLYNVSYTCMFNVVHNITWKHVIID